MGLKGMVHYVSLANSSYGGVTEIVFMPHKPPSELYNVHVYLSFADFMNQRSFMSY